MNDSVLAAPGRVALPSKTKGIRESSRRILRQVINRYTRHVSAIVQTRLTPRQAILCGVSMLWLSLSILFAESLPLSALFTVLFAITSRPLWK